MKYKSVRSISYFLLLALLAFIIFIQGAAALEFYKNESNATTAATGTTTLEKLSLTLNKLVAKTDAIIKSIFGASPKASETIEIRDSKSTPVISDVKTYDETKQQKKTGKTSSLSVADIPDKGELEVDAIASKNVAVKLKINTASRGEVILDDFGKNNPVSVPLPGRIVKYLEIGARNISFSSANVTIRYSDSELNGGNENDLTIYHWNGVSWDALPTTVDIANKTLSASATSLSPFGVATPHHYILSCDTGTVLSTTGGSYSTNFSCGSNSAPQDVGQLPEDTPIGASTRISLASPSIGTTDFAHFINNTAFTTSVNVTGINGSISMSDATNGRRVGGKYEVGYYDPTGPANNFVGLFNSTTATTTSNQQRSYPLSFNSQFGIIPAGKKLAVRVWMNSSVSDSRRFFSGSITSNTDSSINVTISQIGGGVNLTSISALTNTTLAGTNSTYYLNLTNNGTASDTYNITVSNPNGASIFAANITSVTLGAGASKVFTLNVTNTFSGTFRVNVTATALNSSQFGYINTTTSVIAAGVNLTNISALSNTTLAGTNSTYFLNLTNNGTATDIYTITTSNPDNAAIAATNITSVTLGAGASKVFTLNVTNPSSGTFRVNVTATSGTDPTEFGYINTTTTVIAVATSFIYYLENNNTIQSLGADGNTEYSASGTTVMLSTRPYVNLLKNGTMGTNANIRFTTTSTTTEYELFRFYLPFNYTTDTRISANSTFNISWWARATNNRLNVSLIDYNPVTGVKTVIGIRNFTATGGAAQTTYGYQINHSAYTIPKGNRLMFRINTTTPTAGTVRLYFNSYISNITVNETQISGGVNLTNISALSNTTFAGTNSTYYLNLTNNGTASDTYNITVSNPDNAATAGTNITSVTLDAGASKVFTLNVTNPSSGTFRVNVTSTASNSSQSGYINTTTTVTDITPPNITSWGNNNTNNQTLFFNVPVFTSVKFNVTANQTITTHNWTYDNAGQSQNFDNFTKQFIEPGRHYVNVSVTNNNGTDYKNWTVRVNPASWESYNNSAHSYVNNNFIAGQQTVYMFGTGFGANYSYKVAYYDGNNTKRSTDAINADSSGNLSSSYTFASGSDAAGTWHAQVFNAFISPPDAYDTSNTNVIADDSFYVDITAIPEFPAGVMLPFASSLILYTFMRRKIKDEKK
ncbi:MAG: hypothetical protein O8C62_10075 [Candidatus Methanoperedens sp.]|nr:hypothetical protein [Candidatus Methanoperedens sp.]